MRKEEIEFVLQAQCGDDEAFLKLYKRYYSMAFGIAFKLCRNEEDAKDAVQDSFLAARIHIRELQRVDSFDFWLTSIVKTKCQKIFRKNRVIFMDNEQLQLVPGQIETNKEFLPTDCSDEKTNKQLLQSFVKQLKPKQRTCVELMYFKQMSIEEVSNYLQIPKGTVKSRVFSGKSQLKSIILDYEKKQRTTVSFKSDMLGALAITSLLSKEFIFSTIQEAISNFKQQSKAIQSLSIINTVAAVSVVGVVGAGTTQAYQEYQTQHATPPIQETAELSDRDIYYKLMGVANDLDTLTPEIKKECFEYYRKIKNNKGVYWDKLVTMGASEKFEQLNI